MLRQSPLFLWLTHLVDNFTRSTHSFVMTLEEEHSVCFQGYYWRFEVTVL